MSPAEQSVILEHNGVIAAFLFLFSLPLVLPEMWFMFSLYLCHSHLFFKSSSVKITMIYQAHHMCQACIILLNPQYNTYKVLFQFNRWRKWCKQPRVAGAARHAHKHSYCRQLGHDLPCLILLSLVALLSLSGRHIGDPLTFMSNLQIV